MILHSYLAKKLRNRAFSISLLFTAGILTESIVSILHNIETPVIGFKDLFLLMIKEGASSLPIIFNLSFLLSWILMKRELQDKKESLPLLINLWDESNTSRILRSSLSWLTSINILFLFVFNVYIRDLGPSLTDSPLHFVSRVRYQDPISFCTNQTTAIRFEPFGEKNNFHNLHILSYDEHGWRMINAANATVANNFLFLKNTEIKEQDSNNLLRFDSLKLSLLDQKEKSYESDSWSLLDIFSHFNRRERGQILWRLGLMLQPWFFFLLPIRKLEYTPKITLVHKNEISQYSLLFLLYLIGLFFMAKRFVF